jgi:pimeloyl-ACP methyl ester carboxylesterase
LYTDRITGSGGSEQTLLFVHGNPENSSIFRPAIRALEGYPLPRIRLISCDHLGFGRSGRASRIMTPVDHAANLSRLVAHLAPENITLVVHDWGGPIGLGSLLDHPARLTKLLILNSSIFPLSSRSNYRNHPFPVLSWERLATLVPDRFWGRFAAGAVASRAGSRFALLRELTGRRFRRGAASVRDDACPAQFADSVNVASSRYLARLSGTWCDADAASNSELKLFYQRLQRDVVRLWGPDGANIQARLLCGEWDPLGNRENMNTWLQALPQLAGNMSFVPGGHFVAAQHPETVARSIYELLTSSERVG